jgi:hypothetical protein
MAREASQEDAAPPTNSAEKKKKLGVPIRTELEKGQSSRVIVAIARCCITSLYCLKAMKQIGNKARWWRWRKDGRGFVRTPNTLNTLAKRSRMRQSLLSTFGRVNQCTPVFHTSTLLHVNINRYHPFFQTSWSD